MEWRDPNTGQIKTWVWIVGAIGAVLAVFLFTRLSTSTDSSTAGMPVDSSTIEDALSQMEDAIQQLEQNPIQSNPPNPIVNPNPPPTRHTFKSYTVQRGDTWASIAAKFGMTLAQFLKHNPSLKNASGDENTIRGGGRVVQVFDVAPIGDGGNNKQSYVVKAGDTWKSITTQFNITLKQLYRWNPTLPKQPNVKRGGGRTITV